MATFDKILKLTSSLFPTGRAFRGPLDGDFHKLKKALSRSEARFYDDAKSVINSQIPDNDNFSAQDAALMERWLGLITNTDVALSTRKEALIRKLNHPGTIHARQYYLYVQQQLQDAGFDVYVHENRFLPGPTTQSPEEFSNIDYPVIDFEHGEFEHGEVETGGFFFQNKVVNYIEEELDEQFEIGSNFRSTFFIGAQTAGDWAVVDDERKNEFRELILKLKPKQTVAFLLINFT